MARQRAGICRSFVIRGQAFPKVLSGLRLEHGGAEDGTGAFHLQQGHEAIAADRVKVSVKVPVRGSGWIAARCTGRDRHPGQYLAAHTSPVYLRCVGSRAFDTPAAEHMLSLVEGGIEYLNTLATHFDESSRKRMVRLFKEAQQELRGRLLTEGGSAGHHHHHHHG